MNHTIRSALALKYNEETAALMLKRMQQEIDEGSDAIHNHRSVTRLVAADALDDAGRSQEAKWLRTQGPFRIADGKVIGQVYVKGVPNHRYFSAVGALNRMSDWEANTSHLPLFMRYDNRKHSNQEVDNETVFSGHDFPVHGKLEMVPHGTPDNGAGIVIHATEYPKKLADAFRSLAAPYRNGANPQEVEEFDRAVADIENSPVTEDVHPEATDRLRRESP